MGHNHSSSCNGNYSIGYTFFRERVSRPKIEVSLVRSVDRLGFQVTVQRNGIRRPSANCNVTQYNFERQDHIAEIDFLSVDTPYSFYPFAINQDLSVGAYVSQFDSNRVASTTPNTSTTFLASIRISGEHLTWAKDYVLRTNLSELRARRLIPNELIPTENVICSLEEIKEPSLWRRFLSSFSVTRTRITK